MKIAALLSGIVASAFAWAASYFLLHLDLEFLALWPETNSQQLFGLVTWHAIVAAALVGGVLAVLSPLLGGIVLLIAAGTWAGLGLTLPYGFGLQVIVPLALSAIGALSAFGALLRGAARKSAAKRRPSLEDIAREEALRLEPTEGGLGRDDDLKRADDLARAVEIRNDRVDMRGDRLEPDVAQAGPPASSDVIKVEQRKPVRAGPPRGLSGLFIANVAMLLLLTGAVSLLLYSSLRTGQFAAAFSGAPAAPATAAVVPQAEATSAVNPAAAVSTAMTAEIQPAAVPNGDAPAAMQVAAVASATSGDAWGSPFEYCSAVQTVDFPDSRYSGPRVPREIAEALRVPASSSPDRAKWRCYNGAVLGCASFGGPRCAMTPSVSEMLEFCAQNPNATGLLAPNGSWSCNEFEPEVPAGESWPMDPRGFLPGAWVEIGPGSAG